MKWISNLFKSMHTLQVLLDVAVLLATLSLYYFHLFKNKEKKERKKTYICTQMLVAKSLVERQGVARNGCQLKGLCVPWAAVRCSDHHLIPHPPVHTVLQGQGRCANIGGGLKSRVLVGWCYAVQVHSAINSCNDLGKSFQNNGDIRIQKFV
jgi:hypothetical protein